MRLSLAVLVTSLSLMVVTFGVGYRAAPADSTAKFEVRLAPEKTVIIPGETLKLKVEIWNVGADDILIAQKVDATFGNSVLRLFLETGSKRETSRGLIADGIPEPDPDFEKTFVTNWLTLNKAHFYSTYVDMDPIEFPELRKTGRYKVGAEILFAWHLLDARLERRLSERQTLTSCHSRLGRERLIRTS